MSEDDLRIVRSMYEAWSRGDLRGPVEPHPDIEVIRRSSEDAIGIVTGVWRGADEAAESFREWIRSWDDLTIRAEALYDMGDRILVFSHQAGTAKLSGIPYEHRFAEVITIRDGKLFRFHSFWTREEALRELGVSEADLPAPMPGTDA